MAPTSNATSLFPAPTSSPADLSDFANTIGTSVGPILTLFGEQSTKQFLSMSMGWGDNILLTVGPIGILTVIVSAIRIGGYRGLKAVIGRARESRATVEQEFLSSTSEEVCELWSGREIVRITGKPNDMKTLVALRRDKGNDMSLLDAHNAVRQKFLELKPGSGDRRKEGDIDEAAAALAVPSITMNVQGTILDPQILWFWAGVGTLAQMSMLLLPAFTTYYWKWSRKGGDPVPEYAYGCFAAGTIFMTIGMLICCHVVEGSTTEWTFQPSKSGKSTIQRIFRIQVGCEVNSQHFPSCVLLNPKQTPDNMLIRTSRLGQRPWNLWTSSGSIIAVVGFMFQFVGLGALHWSATAISLGVSLLMTCIRAWVRRNLASDPWWCKIPTDMELIWIGQRISRNDWDFVCSEPSGTHELEFEWGFPIGFLKEEPRYLSANEHAQPLVPSPGTKLSLGFLWGPSNGQVQCGDVKAIADLLLSVPNIPKGKCAEPASKISAAMEGIQQVLEKSDSVRHKPRSALGAPGQPRLNAFSGEPMHFCVDVQGGLGKKIRWLINLDDGPQRLADLTAGLSLWTHSMASSTDFNHFTSQIVGPSEPSMKKCLSIWLPELYLDEMEHTVETVASSTIISGLYYSASFKIDDTPDGDIDDMLGSFIYQPQGSGTEPRVKELAFLASAPTVEDCLALEIVSLYMLAICTQIEHVGGGTERVAREDETGAEVTAVENPLFIELAQEIIDAGFHIPFSEALGYVIPAFAKFGLLPGESDITAAPDEEGPQEP